MKNLLFLLIFFAVFSCKEKKDSVRQLPIPENVSRAETTYYLIRHAEKLRDNPKEKNPQLNEKGFERSKYWGEYFNDKKLDLFFTTDYMRTFQTLIPIVYNYKGDIELYDASDSLFTSSFWKKTYGKKSVIVGHSNTTPRFVNEIIGQEEYKDIPDSINSRIYKVVIDNKGYISEHSYQTIIVKP